MLGLVEIIKRITSKNDKTLHQDVEECDTCEMCGQIYSKLKHGVCAWCEDYYKVHK